MLTLTKNGHGGGGGVCGWREVKRRVRGGEGVCFEEALLEPFCCSSGAFQGALIGPPQTPTRDPSVPSPKTSTCDASVSSPQTPTRDPCTQETGKVLF